MNTNYSYQCSIGQRVTKSKKILSKRKNKSYSSKSLKPRVFKVNNHIIKLIQFKDDVFYFYHQ